MDNNDDLKRNILNSLEENIIESGNRFDKISISIQGNRRIPLEANVMLFQAFAYLAATKLKPSTCKVLYYFFAFSEYENYIMVDVKTISENIKMTARSVLSAIKELKEAQIIIITPHPSDKRRNDYFLNPLAAWRGNSYTRKEKMMKLAKKQMDMFEEAYISTTSTTTTTTTIGYDDTTT